MTRIEALEYAEKLVDRLAPSKNARGYTESGGPTLEQRINAVVQVADWLLSPDPDEVFLHSLGQSLAVRTSGEHEE